MAPVNLVQIYRARDVLKEGLLHVEQSPCRDVAAIEYAGRIERFGMHHYIFKFRAPRGPWLLGVVGGYTAEDQEMPGAYVGSAGDRYEEKTARETAIALLDRMHRDFQEGKGPGGEEMDAQEDLLMEHFRQHMKKRGIPVDEELLHRAVKDVLKQTREGSGPSVVAVAKPSRIFWKIAMRDVREISGEKLLSALAEKRGETPQLVKRDQASVLSFSYEKCRFRLEWRDSGEGEEWEAIVREAMKNPRFWGEGRSVSRCDALLDIQCRPEGISLQEAAAVMLQVVQALMTVYPRQILGVDNGYTVQPPRMYTEEALEEYQQKAAADGEKRLPYPLETCLQFVVCPYKRGDLCIFTYGMTSFGLAEVEMEELYPLEDNEFVSRLRDLEDIASQIAAQPERGRAGSAFSMDDGVVYEVVIGRSRFTGPLPVCLLREKESIFLDSLKKIQTHLRRQQVTASQIKCLQRAAFFCRWARERHLLLPYWEELYQQTVDFGWREKDWRIFLRERVMGDCLAQYFLPAVHPFLETYYNYKSKKKGTYFKDLEAYTKQKLAGEEKLAKKIAKAGVDCTVFLPWDEETYEEIKEILDERYAAWKAEHP